MKRLLPFLIGALTFAQTPRAAFEVASIKPNTQGEVTGFDFDFTADGGIRCRNMTVWNLIRSAYKLRELQISGGPSWIKSQGFDIQAKAPQTGTQISRDQTLAMLQTLLEDRFQLKFRRETRQVAAYALTAGARGPQLPPAREGRGRTRMGDLDAPSLTLRSLCDVLEFDLDRPVINQTGLEGPFAIRLQWASDRAPKEAQDPSRPSLFTAIQEQLGLKLNATRAPVEMFIIDSVDRPSEN